jgi:hypothetical protein
MVFLVVWWLQADGCGQMAVVPGMWNLLLSTPNGILIQQSVHMSTHTVVIVARCSVDDLLCRLVLGYTA